MRKKEVCDKQEVVDVATKNPVAETPVDMTDDERSKNSTPLTTHQGDLGATSPAGRKAGDEACAQSDVSASPILTPSVGKQIDPLPAPLDVDSMKLPVHTEESLPYWERLAPLPAQNDRPGTSSRRPQSSAGKLVVYQTEKQKKLKAEAKKKRESDVISSPSSGSTTLPPVTGAKTRASALPPLKERKKKSKKPDEGAAAEETMVLAPVKPVRDWKGSLGGEAWEVTMPEVAETQQPECLKFDSPAKAVDTTA